MVSCISHAPTQQKAGLQHGRSAKPRLPVPLHEKMRFPMPHHPSLNASCGDYVWSKFNSGEFKFKCLLGRRVIAHSHKTSHNVRPRGCAKHRKAWMDQWVWAKLHWKSTFNPWAAWGWETKNWIPSGELTKSNWKWPFIVDFPIKNGDFPLLC